jgi:Mn2+/Fe2+ NRAMP family transporter
VLPLSTAYSVCEFTGHEGALDDGFARAPLFYSTFLLVAGGGAAAVLIPGLPLIPVLVLTQVLNAVLVLPLLVLMYGLSRDPELMGEQRVSPAASLLQLLTIGVIAVCVAALLILVVS